MHDSNVVPVKDFNEQLYLEKNPDVRQAVQKGDFSSGLSHFIAYGINEHRPGVTTEFTAAMQVFLQDSDVPLPPPALRLRVSGSENDNSFNQLGRIISLNLATTLAALPITLNENSRILDFGCGCGRVIRYFHKFFYPNCHFYGSDIDGEAIDWCRNNLATPDQFLVNNEWPPLPFPDDYFDVVYSISIFTHLPEDMQFAWLDELRRVTKKGGYLLLTTHGEALLKSDQPQTPPPLNETGFLYTVGPGTEGLPQFYQTSFHAEDYVRTRWGQYFEIDKIVSKGIANHQDLIIGRKP